AFDKGTLTEDQRTILLWILPLASGFMCGAFAGRISARMNKRGAGWVVAATGGFAIWLLTYFLLPKPAQPALPPNAVTVSLPIGTTFANAAHIISQQEQ